MMKLRLRSLESNQTLKLQFPNSPPCTIAQLKQTLISQIAAPSVYFSLNKKDALEAQSANGNDTLESLGIASGDLVYYSVDANAFEIPNFDRRQTLEVGAGIEKGSGEIGDLKNLRGGVEQDVVIGGRSEGSGSGKCEIDGKFVDSITVEVVGECGVETPYLDFETLEKKVDVAGAGGFKGGHEIVGESSGSNEERVIEGAGSGNREILRRFEYGGGGGDSDESDSEMSYTDSDEENEEEGTEMENMDVDQEVDTGVEVVVWKKFSEQGFLRRVLREELGEDVGNHKLVVIAIHAAFLEAGFVGIDSVSGMRVDRFFLADQWPSLAFGMSLWYTLPEILGSGGDCKVVESVSLRFQSLGQFVNVYGGLVSGGSGTYRVCLDEGRFRPALDAMWGGRVLIDGFRQYFENEVFEFWKIVKDGLALPLMIDLCDKAGLVAPPCFMCLPTELKFKILEALPGVDIARVACVCSELKFLSCNNDLWKKKFAEEYGDEVRGQESGNWKEKFVFSSELGKRMKRAIVPWQPYVSRAGRRDIPFPLLFRDGEALILRGGVGGDYDLLPGFGGPLPFGRRGPGGGAFLRHPARRNFSPSCNLGGFV